MSTENLTPIEQALKTLNSETSRLQNILRLNEKDTRSKIFQAQETMKRFVDLGKQNDNRKYCFESSQYLELPPAPEDDTITMYVSLHAVSENTIANH